MTTTTTTICPLYSLLIIHLLTSPLLSTSFNISHLLYPFNQLPDDPTPPLFLTHVLTAIAENNNWDLRTIRVAKVENVKIGYSVQHTYFVRLGKFKRDLMVRFSDKVDSWRKFETDGGDFEELVRRVSSRAVVPSVELNGPFVLFADGHDRISLRRSMNSSITGLKQILVREGVTLRIEGAQEVTLSLSSCNDQSSDGNSKNNGRFGIWALLQPRCIPLPPIRVVGSVNATAFRKHGSCSTIKYKLVAEDVVTMKRDKCYTRYLERNTPCLLNSSSRVVSVQRLLIKLLAQKNHSSSIHKTHMKGMTVVQFYLDLDRDVRTGESQRNVFPEWRTKPSVQRLWFYIKAVFDVEKLKPLTFKQLKPFQDVDSSFWSILLPNISLTELSNILVRPKPLTLDVKW